MKRILYYIRIVLFILYQIIMFLLIDKILNISLFGNIYFVVNLIYSLITIVALLSKKVVFQNNFAYNIINIGFYLYTGIIYYMALTNTKIDIMNNLSYFQINFALLILLIIGIILFTIELNKEEK